MLTTTEIIARLKSKLDARAIMRKDITEALNFSSASRVGEILKKTRDLKHDEAVILCERFGLEDGDPASPLNGPGARLFARVAANQLGLRLPQEDPRLAKLARSFEALARLLADPRYSGTPEAAEAALLAIEAMNSPAPRATPAR